MSIRLGKQHLTLFPIHMSIFGVHLIVLVCDAVILILMTILAPLASIFIHHTEQPKPIQYAHHTRLVRLLEKHISLGIAADYYLTNQFKVQLFNDSQNFKAMMWGRTKLQQYIITWYSWVTQKVQSPQLFVSLPLAQCNSRPQHVLPCGNNSWQPSTFTGLDSSTEIDQVVGL